MPVPLRSLLIPPIGFAHRGASADAPENTIEAFELALRLDAPGLESDAWITEDGVVVLDHDGVVGRRPRRRRITELPRNRLPGHIPSLGDLYAACGADFQLSLDVQDPSAATSIIAVANAAGGGASGRLWLCHPHRDVVAGWRTLDDEVRLVHSTRRSRLQGGWERAAASLDATGVDAINLPHREWTGGLVTLFHRFGVFALGWDAQHERELRNLLAMGADGVYSDHVERMVAALKEAQTL